MSSETITRNDLTNILNEIVAIDGTDMTAQEISNFVDSLNVTGINAVDYVVEQGSGNGWKYRKWESGRLEQWYESYFMSYNVNTARGSFYSGAWTTLTFPVAFTSSHTVTACATISTDAYIILAQVEEFNTDTVKMRLVSSGSMSGNNYRVFAYAEGTWK